MKKTFIQMLLPIVVAAVITSAFCGCGKAQTNPEITAVEMLTTLESATEETTRIGETLETVNPAQVDYGKWNPEVNETLEKLYGENKELFKNTVDLMLIQKDELIVSCDLGESVSEPHISDGKGGSLNINEVFSKEEQNLIIKCLKIMSEAAPEYARSVRIDKTTSNTLYKLGVNFMYRTKLNIDVGILYTETLYSISDLKRLDNNFYSFRYGLV